MPIATPAQFADMLDAAQEGSYAYPAINCTSIVTINAALKAFADKKSDGIIQFSTGAGQFASGLNNSTPPTAPSSSPKPPTCSPSSTTSSSP